jgi:restriction system protein
MAIPTFEECFRPVLELATREDITRRSTADAMCNYFKMTPEEREERTKGRGYTFISSRTGWAMTYLTKAGLIELVAPKTYRATKFGKKYLIEHPNTITFRNLSQIHAYAAWKKSCSTSNETGCAETEHTETDSSTPIEAIDNAINTIHADLKSRLLHEILQQDPTFFEKLVLDVLVAMGYGGSRIDAAEHLGRSNDEGIDGCINQDPLGLDQVLVQAKRYGPENLINREDLQSFSGAMSGKGVNKGVFITTSHFNTNAKKYALNLTSQKMILIDGALLLELMLKHHVGTRVERAIEILDLDQNYFNDED